MQMKGAVRLGIKPDAAFFTQCGYRNFFDRPFFEHGNKVFANQTVDDFLSLADLPFFRSFYRIFQIHWRTPAVPIGRQFTENAAVCMKMQHFSGSVVRFFLIFIIEYKSEKCNRRCTKKTY